MASKIIITLPSSSFQNPVQGNLEKTKFMHIPYDVDKKNSNVCLNSNVPDVMLRVDELEKTVTFLKEEQKCMLHNLHEEITSLQTRNRDLLCQLIFKSDNDFRCQNINDSDVKYILMSHDSVKYKQNLTQECLKDSENSVEDVFELKYTIDQQQREIEYLKGQLELVSLRNKTQNQESRQVDNYIREVEEKNRDQEKLIKLLRKENKEQKAETENLRKTLSNIRINNQVQVPQSIQITQVQPQTQIFPPVRTPSTFWCQNRPIPITEYQLQRNSVSANGCERAPTNIPGVSFALPPVCSYRQVAVTAPPRFYNNANYFYSVAQRPVLRGKSCTNENIRSPSKNIQNG